MVKPIQDALIGLVYEDDRLITDTVVRKTSIDAPIRVRGYPIILLEALRRRRIPAYHGGCGPESRDSVKVIL